MLQLRYSLRWRIAGALLLSLVLVAALMPELNWFSRAEIRTIMRADKWLHFASFIFLTAWYTGQYARRDYWRLALGLALFGGLIEICQAMTVYRHADWEDFFADLGGIAVGLLIGLAGLGGWSGRVEQWWIGRRQVSD